MNRTYIVISCAAVVALHTSQGCGNQDSSADRHSANIKGHAIKVDVANRPRASEKPSEKSSGALEPEFKKIGPRDPVPRGWIRNHTHGTRAKVTGYTIVRCDDLPVGTVLNMLKVDTEPDGWDKFGIADPDGFNAKQPIRRAR